MTEDSFGNIPIRPSIEGAGADTPTAVVIKPAGERSRHSSPRDKRPRMTQLPFRLIAWVLSPVLLIILLGILSYFTVPWYVENRFFPGVAENLERPVRAGRIVFSPVTMELFLTDVFIGSRLGDLQADRQLMEDGSLTCRVSLPGMVRGRVICDRVDLAGVHVIVRRNSDGSSDLTDMLRLFFPRMSGEHDRLWPVWLGSRELSVESGKVTFDDTVTGKQFTVEDIELTFPTGGGGRTDGDRLPRLKAVVNGSPVEAGASWVLNDRGMLETSLDMQLTNVFLPSYLDYLPLADADLKLADGRADTALKVLFAEGTGLQDGLVIHGQTKVSAARLVDPAGDPLAILPETRFGFVFKPGTGALQLEHVVFSEPRFFAAMGSKAANGPGGLYPVILDILADAVAVTSGLVVIEGMEGKNGTVSFKGTGPPERKWENVEFRLTDPRSQPNAGENARPPGYFVLTAVDKALAKEMKVSVEGQLIQGKGGIGRVSMTGIDLAAYRKLLPAALPTFDKGMADIRFAFEIVRDTRAESKAGDFSLLLTEGYLDVANYMLQPSTSTGMYRIGGRHMVCADFKTDPVSKLLTCSALAIKASEFKPAGSSTTGESSTAGGSNGWRVASGELDIQGSKLYFPFLSKLCPGGKPITLQNLSVRAKRSAVSPFFGDVTLSAAVGSRGSVAVKGKDPFAGKGNMQLTVSGIDLRTFSPCLSPYIRPAITGGECSLDGTLVLPAVRFEGSGSIRGLTAGVPKGASVAWQEATAASMSWDMQQNRLSLGDVKVVRPVIRAGLLETGNPLDNFLAGAKRDRVMDSVSSLSIEHGTFAMPWPVFLSGYQPEVTSLAGKMSTGDNTGPRFDITGDMAGIGIFYLNGRTEDNKIASYRLNIPALTFAPFNSFVTNDLGLQEKGLSGSWTRTYEQAGQERKAVDTLALSGVVPVADTSFAGVWSYLVDAEGSLRLDMQNRLAVGERMPLILESIRSYLRRQDVRAAISPQLLLQEAFSELYLVDSVPFDPGSDVIGVPERLGSYAQVLQERPLLGIVLTPYIDENSDREALRVELQREEDQRREIENRRRALERERRLAEQRQRHAAATDTSVPVVVEEILPEELTGELDPLPRVEVQVPNSMLVEIAKRRVQQVHKHLVNAVGLAPGRISVSDGFLSGSPAVGLSLVPVGKLANYRRNKP